MISIIDRITNRKKLARLKAKLYLADMEITQLHKTIADLTSIINQQAIDNATIFKLLQDNASGQTH